MTSLVADIVILIGAIAYGIYIGALLYRGRQSEGRTRSQIPASNGIAWAAFSSLGINKRSLAFQRVGRRI